MHLVERETNCHIKRKYYVRCDIMFVSNTDTNIIGIPEFLLNFAKIQQCFLFERIEISKHGIHHGIEMIK